MNKCPCMCLPENRWSRDAEPRTRERSSSPVQTQSYRAERKIRSSLIQDSSLVLEPRLGGGGEWQLWRFLEGGSVQMTALLSLVISFMINHIINVNCNIIVRNKSTKIIWNIASALKTIYVTDIIWFILCIFYMTIFGQFWHSIPGSSTHSGWTTSPTIHTFTLWDQSGWLFVCLSRQGLTL